MSGSWRANPLSGVLSAEVIIPPLLSLMSNIRLQSGVSDLIRVYLHLEVNLNCLLALSEALQSPKYEFRSLPPTILQVLDRSCILKKASLAASHCVTEDYKNLILLQNLWERYNSGSLTHAELHRAAIFKFGSPEDEVLLSELIHEHTLELRKRVSRGSTLALPQNTDRMREFGHRCGAEPLQIRDVANAVSQTINSRFKCECSTQHIGVRLALGTYHNTRQSKESTTFDLHLERTNKKWQEIQIDIPLTRVSANSTIRNTTMSGQLGEKNHREIKSLCKQILSKGISDKRMPLVAQNGELRRMKPTRTHYQLGNSRQQPSLRDFIESSDGPEQKKALLLAIVLAYTALYLEGGDWGVHWSKEDIVFCQVAGAKGNRPFLLTSLKPTSFDDKDRLHDSKSSENSDDEDDFDELIHQYPGLVSLGTMLIELYYGRTIEVLSEKLDLDRGCDKESFGDKSNNERLETSLLVYETLNEDLSDCYASAIKACLDSHLGIGDDDEKLPPQEFQRHILERIISPLETELGARWSNISLDQIDALVQELEVPRVSRYTCPNGKLSEQTTCHHDLCPPHSKTTALIDKDESNVIYKAIFPLSVPDMDSRSPKAFGIFHDNTPMQYPIPLCEDADNFMNSQRLFYDRFINDDFEDEHLSASASSDDSKLGITSLYPARGYRIKVAILDTGLDMNHIDVEARVERIKDVRSWLHGSEGVQDKFGGDESGHGTHVANIFLDMSPDCDVYIARIAKIDPESPQRIAKAVEYSVRTWQVDIISMSFGFPDETSSGCFHLKKAIQMAYYDNVLLFAAASNHGGTSGPAFPARHENVFCIYGSDGLGNSSRTNPTASSIDSNFSTLGEAVESSWPLDGRRDGKLRKSGTSYATPIASGIAAVILLYARQNMSAEEAKKFKEYRMMRDMLHYISHLRHEYNFISLENISRNARYLPDVMRQILTGTWRKN